MRRSMTISLPALRERVNPTERNSTAEVPPSKPAHRLFGVRDAIYPYNEEWKGMVLGEACVGLLQGAQGLMCV